MDWRRAKSVLIIAFLMLNVLLGYQLWTEWRERLNTTADWTSLPPETQQVMREKNIKFKVEAKIPTETPLMRELTYTFNKRVGLTAEERIVLDPAPETRIVYFEQELADSLGDVIPDLSAYTFDDPSSREGVFVFNRMIYGFPIFKIHLEFYYSEQRIRTYSQDLIDIQPSLTESEQKVLPASKAIASLIERNLPADSTIKEIRLGYYGEIFDVTDRQVVAPSWRVLLENGEVYYVNAISAEVATEKVDVQANS
ncbi:MAG: two-component system regulatory protein YycI [Candidatus Cohnella colombiensis]|uniref:Two-component system regulatory protein YycI n=1 Tax=Candidatus Cohnella colombiensis TaxID=3121368 RepID=A0AA95EZP7_9BACL|nr:MAG: two-component system regulatory protein YycI [Cohnella sp.]